MTGYIDPPAGVEIRDGMNYNPYFPGGAISMARVLFDGLVEYDDGQHTPSSPANFISAPVYDRYPRHHLPNGERRYDIPELGCRARA